MLHKKYRTLLFAAVFLLMLSHSACKKYIEVDSPVTSITSVNVYTNDVTAAAVLTGMYANLSALNVDLSTEGLTSLSAFAGLSADELTLYNPGDFTYGQFYTNNLTADMFSGNFWLHIYSMIYYANAAIEGLNNSSRLTPEVRQQLLGEAKFMRALYYFYAVNLYGDVPLATSSDYIKNSLLTRSPASQIYDLIISDLKEAQSLLSEKYLKSDALTAYGADFEQRVRPAKGAATALLARAYLYNGNWQEAEQEATKVIDRSALYELSPLAEVFTMNSRETIWSLQPVGTGFNANTGDGALFILPPTGPNEYPNTMYLSNTVVNSFEKDDQRKTNWVDSVIADAVTYYFPFKYRIGAEEVATGEYIMMLRLAEQYLIRAEARARQGDIGGSQEDINTIRNRAGLDNTTAGDKPSLIQAILHERQVELFTELGHRWLDLKRTNTIDAVMSNIAAEKGADWAPYKSIYPIPQSDIIRNPNIRQNQGY